MRILLAALLLLLVGCSSTGPDGGGPSSGGPSSSSERHHHSPDPGSSEPAPPAPAAPPAFTAIRCPAATTTVHTADQLTAALNRAEPGTTIQLAPGTYVGKFVTTTSGTATRPIFLCGGADAIIDGGGIKAGYAVHVDGGSYWRLVGFTVRNSQKGVVLDHSQHSIVQGLTVQDIGDEAIHVRTASSDNVIADNTIHDTGKRRDKFGEGIYVGTAESNWCQYTGCKPDRSNRNLVRGNHISATTSEAVDIKEGTTSGWLIGNTFDGSGLTGADSWVDVKGNGWLISDNTGHHSPQDGFQTHQVVAGWGSANVFHANTADVQGPGYGFHLAPVAGNSVACSNHASGAAQGLSNVDCR